MALDKQKSNKLGDYAKSKGITPSSMLEKALTGVLTAVILVFAFPLLAAAYMFTTITDSPTAYNGYGLSGPKNSSAGRSAAFKREMEEQQKQSILLKAQQQRGSAAAKSSGI